MLLPTALLLAWPNLQGVSACWSSNPRRARKGRASDSPSVAPGLSWAAAPCHAGPRQPHVPAQIAAPMVTKPSPRGKLLQAALLQWHKCQDGLREGGFSFPSPLRKLEAQRS